MPGSQLNTDYWMTEYITPYDMYQHGLTQIYCHKRTAFQEMAIVESGAYGKALCLDGKWQSSMADEFLYHEPMVHPAMVAHGNARDVLILGGGEGATAREALRWPGVQRVVMVDIDGEVVEACKQYLPEMADGAWDNPKFELVVGDAVEFLDHAAAEWDVVISDLCDPLEEGPAAPLFTQDYFGKVKSALREGGVLCIQAGPTSPIDIALHVRLIHTLGTVFGHVAPMVSYIPGYAVPYSFGLCADFALDKLRNPAAVDACLAEHGVTGLRMYDGLAQLGLLGVGKHLRDAYAVETRPFTLDDKATYFGKGIGQG